MAILTMALLYSYLVLTMAAAGPTTRTMAMLTTHYTDYGYTSYGYTVVVLLQVLLHIRVPALTLTQP